MTAPEQPLAGGFITTVVRVGDTVRRTPPPRADYVAALLRHLEPTGLAPRYLGVDERGRQVLSHLDGRVPWRGIEAGADRDEPGMRRLRAAGAVDAVRGWQSWLLRHRQAVEAATAVG